MDTRTGEIFEPELVDSARKKVEANDFDGLTARERRFIRSDEAGYIAWITPEVVEQVQRGQEAIDRAWLQVEGEGRRELLGIAFEDGAVLLVSIDAETHNERLALELKP